MRIRTIKPGFWDSVSVGKLADPIRLLYAATWNMSDDEGLISPWNVQECRAICFRYQDRTAEEVQSFMRELIDTGHIVIYKSAVDNNDIAWIPTFGCHQVINRPMPSKLTPPPLNDEDILRAYYRRHKGLCCVCGEFVSIDDEDLDKVVVRKIGSGQYPSNIVIAHTACQCDSKGKKKPKSKSKAKAPSWLTEYAEIWSDAYGGQMAYSTVARAFKALENEHGRDRTMSAFKNYCGSTPARFNPTVHKFRATFGQWSEAVAEKVVDEGLKDWK